jgi:hypothetical protein
VVGLLLVRAQMTPPDGFAGAERSLARAKAGNTLINADRRPCLE